MLFDIIRKSKKRVYKSLSGSLVSPKWLTYKRCTFKANASLDMLITANTTPINEEEKKGIAPRVEERNFSKKTKAICFLRAEETKKEITNYQGHESFSVSNAATRENWKLFEREEVGTKWVKITIFEYFPKMIYLLNLL